MLLPTLYQSVTAVLLWLQTNLSGALRRRVTSWLFVTVEIDSPVLVACMRNWATQQAQQKHARRPGRMVVLNVGTRAFMRRVMHAAGDALRAGRTITYFGTNLIMYTASGLISSSDCLSYVVLQPADGGAARSADSGADCCAWVKPPAGRRASALERVSRAVWVHARQEGGAPGVGLLTGAPEPLLKMLENSGLRDLMAPKPDGSGGGGGDGSGGGRAFVSVLRWHGLPLVHAALEAAYTQQKADDAGTFKLSTVTFPPKHQGGGYGGYPGGPGGGGGGGATEVAWSSYRERIARPMRTVVLPAEAAGVRRTAKRFVSAQYRAFCRIKGLPHRCGFALWGCVLRFFARVTPPSERLPAVRPLSPRCHTASLSTVPDAFARTRRTQASRVRQVVLRGRARGGAGRDTAHPDAGREAHDQRECEQAPARGAQLLQHHSH